MNNLLYGLKKSILEYFKCPKELNNECKSHLDDEKIINDILQFLQNFNEKVLRTVLTLMMNFNRI
jgi:hypothetical protein